MKQEHGQVVAAEPRRPNGGARPGAGRKPLYVRCPYCRPTRELPTGQLMSHIRTEHAGELRRGE